MSKVIVITGASSGIGKALAERYLAAGDSVSICGIDAIELETTVAEFELRFQNPKIHYQVADLREQKQCEEFIANTIAAFGRIDVLINNAGITMINNLVNARVSDIENVMQLNFFGSVYCTKAALPHLIESEGSIVAISSVAGLRGIPKRTGYSASKFAVQGFFESLRTELVNTGVHVLVVSPWFTQTAIRKSAGATFKKSGTHTPEYVAEVIIDAVAKRKRDLVLGFFGKLTAKANVFFPRIFDRLLVKYFAESEK